MKPEKNEDTFVDVLDVLLRDGAIVRADVIVSVAEIPLVGIKLTAAIAGMETMTEYGLFEEWDTDRRVRAVERRRYGRRKKRVDPDEDLEDIAQLEEFAVDRPEGRKRADRSDGDDETASE
ncbi:gas vesicle protein GvpM [Natronococcus wangiae]|uniref:gas vesicle protein GvpM n=1 Tax=Natronococcus wangiae TaxID=3068275 RepID=UPI00273DCE79|nr:gas vesicle protein [Natronococcus sp. AD5]